MADFIEVHVTAADRDEADRICTAAVTNRLAACAQVATQIRSTYRWEGEIQQSDEWLILMKTTGRRFAELSALIQDLHSYDVPEIVAIPITLGTPAYLEWISKETSPQ
ncbi:divalent-cation tolerance protein CutA [Nonomuraea longicatena]|uniref:Divalent-cation tolerance protein CutA n=1 Tax=Nonomuraea longicatena TaxID=83682 RepID=A0ABN1R7G5_9ACTN